MPGAWPRSRGLGDYFAPAWCGSETCLLGRYIGRFSLPRDEQAYFRQHMKTGGQESKFGREVHVMTSLPRGPEGSKCNIIVQSL